MSSQSQNPSGLIINQQPSYASTQGNPVPGLPPYYEGAAGQTPGSPLLQSHVPSAHSSGLGDFPELEPLTRLEHIFIKQGITDGFFNSRNHYKVLKSNGEPIFEIVEKTGLLRRLLGGGGGQSFSLTMKNLSGLDVLYIKTSGGICGGGIDVSCQNIKIGEVQSSGDCCGSTKYDLMDQTGNTVLVVKSQDGCWLCTGTTGTAEFHLVTPDGSQIGRIGKEWGGFVREFFSSADTFGVNFPIDLHVSIKAVILAAAILIDFQLFEGR